MHVCVKFALNLATKKKNRVSCCAADFQICSLFYTMHDADILWVLPINGEIRLQSSHEFVMQISGHIGVLAA